MPTDVLISYLGGLHYLGLFIILAFVGFLIPFPEEIVLLSIGYIAALANIQSAGLILLVALAGVFCGDILVFFLATHGSRLVGFTMKRIAPKKLAKYDGLVNTNAPRAIFLMRFIIGLRIISPILAATHCVKWKTFLAADFFALLIYIPIFFFLGYFFNQNLTMLISKVMVLRHFIFIGALFVILFAIVMFVRKIIIRTK